MTVTATVRSSVELEILRTRFVAAADELAATLAHSASTVEVGQAREFCVAICDPRGGVVAIDNALELASMEATVSHVSSYFEFDIDDGDVVLTNDPFAGGTRVQDVTLVAPFFVESDILAYVAVRVRIRDIGGQVGGGINPEASELLAEGVVVTPVKLQRVGRPVRDIVETFLLNGRRPDETRRTMAAALAVLKAGRNRLAEQVNRHGASLVQDALSYAQSYSEQIVRGQIRRWTPGSYGGESLLRLDSTADLLAVRVDADINDGSVRLDFTASDVQSGVFVNSPRGVTASCAVRAVLAVIGDVCPPNSGVLRVVEVVTRPGTLVDPQQPAAVGWGASTAGAAATDAVAEALRSAQPHRVPALTTPRPVVLCRRTHDRSTQVDLGRWAVGGASATSSADAWGAPNLACRGELPSVEQWESDQLPTIESFEYAPGSGGHGTHVGAPGVEIVFLLPPDHLFTLWVESLGSAVPGAEMGEPGRPGSLELEAAHGWVTAPASLTEGPLEAKRLRLRMPGGGGFGPPTERDPGTVLEDIRDGLITRETASAVYAWEGQS